MIDFKALKGAREYLEDAQHTFEEEVFNVLYELAKSNNLPIHGYGDLEYYEIKFQPMEMTFLYNIDGNVTIEQAVITENISVSFHDKEGESYFVDSFYPPQVVELMEHICKTLIKEEK